MMKTKFLTWGGALFALCAMFMVTSCSSDDETPTSGEESWEPVTDGIATATFTGVVQPDGWGTLRGVTVTSGDQTAQTDINGMYKLERVKVVGGRAVVKFQKTGYMSVVRSVPVQKTVRLDVNMRSCTTNSFASSTSQKVTLYGQGSSDQMTVELPADGFVTESGAAYNGAVVAQSVYLDPDNDEFTNSMPGDLTALRTDNSEAQLVSYGMVAVELTDGANNKLQLASGKTATLTFPVPDKFKSGTLPASIPLWSFDEEKGLWIEEGAANLNGAGDAYVGTVTHFSWHNLDMPELRATLKVKVQDNNGGVVPNVLVDVDGQRKVYTNNDGIATCTVPSNTDMVITIPSESYGNYANVWNAEYGYYQYDENQIVKQNVTLAAQEEKTITMQMPVRIPIISGKITNEGTGSQVCLVWITYAGGETTRTIADLNGNYSLLAPATYRGEATLSAQYGDGYKVQQKFTITDNDQVVNMTTNSSAPVSVGVLQVVGDGLNMRYDLPKTTDEDYRASVNLTARGLEAAISLSHQKDQSNWGWVEVFVNIPDYVEGTSTYTSSGNAFRYMVEGMEGWTQLQSMGELTINVTKSGDTYTFKIAGGDAQLIVPSLGLDWNNAAAVKFSVEFSAKNTEEIPE